MKIFLKFLSSVSILMDQLGHSSLPLVFFPTCQSSFPTFPLRLYLCRHGHYPLLPGIPAAFKVTSTLSRFQCPKQSYFLIQMCFEHSVLLLELGSDVLGDEVLTHLPLNTDHWNHLFCSSLYLFYPT
jgi:hypothetical protein